MKQSSRSIRPFVGVEHWGRECFVHDPSGILWHFGEFLNK